MKNKIVILLSITFAMLIIFLGIIGVQKNYINFNMVSDKDKEFGLICTYIKDIIIDLQYATDNNITGKVIYENNDAYLRMGTINKLKKAQEIVKEKGYRIVVWDAYRESKYQYKLWEIVPDEKYIANPYKGYSDHTRGNCVDVTLANENGEILKMPSNFDEFSEKADRNYTDIKDEEVIKNVSVLEKAMNEAGFVGYKNEWWHYTDRDTYDIQEELNKDITTNIKISAVGDCVIGNSYAYSYKNSINEMIDTKKVGYDYFFSGVYDILSKDDFTIANAENVFTTSNVRVFKWRQVGGCYWFKGEPEYTKVYKEGSVEIVNVANNHSMDYLDIGFEESKMAFKNEGIGVCRV